MIDARGIPTCTCPECGGVLFSAFVSFNPETYTIGMYHLDIRCTNCGAMCTAPTPDSNPSEKDKGIGK